MNLVEGLVSRDLSMGPPPRRTSEENKPTLLVSWWCTGVALVIILFRVFGRKMRTNVLFTEDKIMALSIIPLMIRMALVHPILLFGTNNATTNGLTAHEIDLREIGSKLVIASRIFYALFIWTAKFTVSEFLKRLVSTSWNKTHERVLHFIRIFLIVTFFGVVISTLTECQPFDHYWQVVPDPGANCRNGYSQLFTMGICDIITDILLVAFPIPIIVRSAMPLKRKISLCVLFALSVILIVITSFRVKVVVEYRGLQQRRSLWASIEIMAAAAVSNALVLGSFIRDRGVKKAKFKSNSRTGSVDQPSIEPSINKSMTKQHWGNDSDEDLFRSLGCRLNSTSEGMEPVPRAPSKAFINDDGPLLKADGKGDPKFFSAKYTVDQSTSESSSDGNDITVEVPRTPGNTFHLHGSQRMNFFDVGGILEANRPGTGEDGDVSPTMTYSPSSSILAQDFAPGSRRGSAVAANSELNWPLPTSVAAARHNARQTLTPPNRGHVARRESQVPTTNEEKEEEEESDLQDPGGLLSR